MHSFSLRISTFYHLNISFAVALRIPLEDARHYAEADDTGLNFVSEYQVADTEIPEGAILFREVQQNGQMAYMWFDFEEEQFPVVLRDGSHETVSPCR